jgi:nitroreductase
MSQQFETFTEIVNSRRSMRAFLPQPVAPDVIKRIFGLAQRAPSNCNTQPWLTHIVSGDTLEKMRQDLPQRFEAGELTLDYPYDGNYAGVYKERQHGAAFALYDAQGIDRADKAARRELLMRNFRFFDAPHAAFLFLPEEFSIREAADLGMYAQTLMLALTAHGLGSCPQTSLSFVTNAVKEHLGIDSSSKLMFGLSFGHVDWDDPVNQCHTDRAGLEDTVIYHR